MRTESPEARSAERRRCDAWSLSGAAALVATLGVAAACHQESICGAPPGRPSAIARIGLERGTETLRAMAMLGLRWSPDANASDVALLGYPNLSLAEIARAETPFTGDKSALHHTYAAGGDPDRCDGDLRFRLDGRHGELTTRALAADLDALVAAVRPTDVYTHAGFDGHPDHAEVFRQVRAALERSHQAGTLHATLIHPEGSGRCMASSADRWPNPPTGAGGPFARFTPTLDVEPPPLPACATPTVGAAWGPDGPPTEIVEVPSSMQAADPEQNLKWRVIAAYASQIDCTPDAQGRYHASCGYMRAFVKRHEFFWTQRYGDAGASSAGGPVLVVAAHPDDEALGAAGVNARARDAGRRVVVAVVTNGDSPLR